MPVLLLILVLFVATMVILWLTLKPLSGSEGDDDPDSGGGGLDRGRRPAKPPPDPPVCWDELEPQFADRSGCARPARRRLVAESGPPRRCTDPPAMRAIPTWL